MRHLETRKKKVTVKKNLQRVCHVDVLAVCAATVQNLDCMQMNSAQNNTQSPGNLRKEVQLALWQWKGDTDTEKHK